MKIKTQLTLATLMAMGLFATGCSQQTAGASQTVSSAQQTTSQATSQTSQQAVATTTEDVVTGEEFVTTEEIAPAVQVKEVVKTVYDCSKCGRTPPRVNPPRTNNQWTHTHPAIPGCTDSVTHTHKYTDRNHKHRYSCRGQKVRPPVRPIVRPPVRPPVPRQNKWTHTHPAIPGCTDSVTHTHPYTDRNHKHRYSCRGQRPVQPVRPTPRPIYIPRPIPVPVPVPVPTPVVVPDIVVPPVKPKGNYRGPILMSPQTRDLMQQYQQ